MDSAIILPLADPRAALALVGGKGASLARMAAAGLPIPAGFYLTTAAYQAFVAENALQPAIAAALAAVDPQRPSTLDDAAQRIQAGFAGGRIPSAVARAVAQAYRGLGAGAPAVAVRSSATAEDLPEASFAGQQDSFLNICGEQAVVEAVRRCWASLWSARAIGYRARQGLGAEGVALAVVVQLLVPAEAAGIMFTADPVSGAQAATVISAAWGLGEAVVGGQVTPDTLTVDKASGRVTGRTVADKRVMTVRRADGTALEPVPRELRLRPVLDDAQAEALARHGAQIEALFQRPMDIEWALAGGRISILQARPVTALPQATPALPAPAEWRLPRGVYAAARNNIVELMAEPLSPLFATLGLAAVNASLKRVMAAFGMQGMLPEEPIITVNQYAYYNGSLKARDLARVLLRAGGIMRRMFTGAVERWTADGRPRYQQAVACWQAQDWRAFSALALVDGVSQLTEAAIDAYAVLVSGAIPAAWISEALFTAVYDRLIRRPGDPPAATYLLGYDSLPIRADKALFRLAAWARRQPALRDYLERTPAAQLAAGLARDQAPDDLPPALWREWGERFRAHLNTYGHMLYDLDFAHAVPADRPAPVLEAFRLYLRGQGADPYARQQESALQRTRATEATTRRLRGWRRRLFQTSLARAQRYAPLREDGLAEIGLAYPLIRQLLRELGGRMAQRGVIPAAEEIFWLTEAEVRLVAGQLDAGQAPAPLAEPIALRRAEHAAMLGVSPPRLLPRRKLFGRELGSRRQRRRPAAQGEVITGVACGRGRITATARVVRGPEDFDQLAPGEVLVAPITTPAWTPLFALASAVVTDIGGPLSHGSIVAREYGIPAVLGTGVATRRIHSGDTVTVDGGAGTVALAPT